MWILFQLDRSSPSTVSDVSVSDLAAKTQQIMRNVGVMMLVVD